VVPPKVATECAEIVCCRSAGYACLPLIGVPTDGDRDTERESEREKSTHRQSIENQTVGKSMKIEAGILGPQFLILAC